MAGMKLCLVSVILCLLVFSSISCSSAPEFTTSPSGNTELEEPELSAVLKKDCSPASARGDFGNIGLQVGEVAVNFTLRDIHGAEFRLSRFLAEKPVMMVFGSFT